MAKKGKMSKIEKIKEKLGSGKSIKSTDLEEMYNNDDE